MIRLALIAGDGALPRAIQGALDHPALVCAPAGVCPEGLAVELEFRLERLVPFLRDLGDRGVEDVVMAGAMNRPVLDPSLFDRETASLVPGLMAALTEGDDGALRWVIHLFEEFDFRVRGVRDLAPGLLIEDGCFSERPPTPAQIQDAERGRAILDALSTVDVGQGCAVVAGQCLGIESVYGTDALLAGIARNRPLREPAKGGVFVKRTKAGQDLRVDLPTIGPATIEAVIAAGLHGICLQAGRVIVLERALTIEAANRAGIALWAMP